MRKFLMIAIAAFAVLAMTSQVVYAANVFNYKAITNGGGNRFWVTDTNQYKVAGADVAGRETYYTPNDWLVRAVDLYDGSVVSNGSVNGPVSANQVTVQSNNIVKLAGNNVGGQYRYQFDNQTEAENFAKFFRAAADAGVLLTP